MSKLDRGLSGYVCVRNGDKLDYCWREAVASLLPVCDEVLIFVGLTADEHLAEPTRDDGTFAEVRALASCTPKVRVAVYPWDNPHRDIHFWVKWLNAARAQLKFDMQLELDADEVLDPRSYAKLRELAAARKCALFKRLNYWRDPAHLAPHNRCCGTMVARLGPTDLYMPSDEPTPAFSPNVRSYATEYEGLLIHHFGFLRKPEAFIEKSVVVQNAFFGQVDSRLTEAAAQGKDWRDREYFDGLPLERATEPLPDSMRPWLMARGYGV